MEHFKVTKLGTRADGSPITRCSFVNDDNTNYLVLAQSYFSQREKKEAKWNYKLNQLMTGE